MAQIPGYLKFIKSFLDELNNRGIVITDLVNPNQCKCFQGCKKAKESTNKNASNEGEGSKVVSNDPRHSNLDEIRAVVDIWNGLNKKQKSEWMEKQSGDSTPCITIRVSKFIKATETTLVSSDKKSDVAKKRARSLQKSSCKSGVSSKRRKNQQNSNNNAAKPKSIKRGQSKKVSTSSVKVKKVTKSPASKRLLERKSKTKASVKEPPKQTKSTKPIPGKRKNGPTSSTANDGKSTSVKRPKPSAKSTKIKSITETKKFKRQFGERKCNSLTAKVKLRHKKYCGKPPAPNKHVPVVWLDNSTPSLMTNHDDDNNNNNALKSTGNNCRRTYNPETIPKYYRGREPRYPDY